MGSSEHLNGILKSGLDSNAEEGSVTRYQRGSVSRSNHSRNVKLGRKTRPRIFGRAFQVLFITILTLTASSLSAHAAQSPAKFKPGTYTGIFFFSFKHTFNQSSENIITNYYDLQSSNAAMGNLKFSVEKNGIIREVRVKINPFYYNVVGSLQAKTDDSCKGYNASGVGLGTARTASGSSKPPTLSIQSSDIKMVSGAVLGFASPIGDCGGNPPADTFINAVRADIDSLPASPWEFTATVVHDKWAAGTCTTSSWQVADRSFDCVWQVFRK